MQLLVYDEIHYLRDKERGVVWEESIILAPKACRFAFLSATIPNAMEFAVVSDAQECLGRGMREKGWELVDGAWSLQPPFPTQWSLQWSAMPWGG